MLNSFNPYFLAETLCKELDEERKSRFSLQQKLKDAHEALQRFSVRVLAPSGQPATAAAAAAEVAGADNAPSSAAPKDYSVRPNNEGSLKQTSSPSQQRLPHAPLVNAAATPLISASTAPTTTSNSSSSSCGGGGRGGGSAASAATPPNTEGEACAVKSQVEELNS